MTATQRSFPQCRDCKHWQGTYRHQLADYPRDKPDSEWYFNGICKRIQYALDITASGGWDGATVDSVETDANFGCVLFEAVE